MIILQVKAPLASGRKPLLMKFLGRYADVAGSIGNSMSSPHPLHRVGAPSEPNSRGLKREEKSRVGRTDATRFMPRAI
jgi:hypothetical protein